MNEALVAIRAAAPKDAAVLATLEAACFPQAWSKETIEAALADEKYVILIAHSSNEIHGYALSWQVGEEAEFARLGVLPSQRGRGLGELLLRATLEELKQRGAREIFLEVRESNEVAHRLYARVGFEEIARRKEYYDDGESAVVMRTTLHP